MMKKINIHLLLSVPIPDADKGAERLYNSSLPFEGTRMEKVIMSWMKIIEAMSESICVKIFFSLAFPPLTMASRIKDSFIY